MYAGISTLESVKEIKKTPLRPFTSSIIIDTCASSLMAL